MVPDDLQAKMLEVIACATQLDGLSTVEVSGKIATCDMHMFGASPKWSRNLHVWGKAAVMAEGKDSKTGDKRAAMMFMGYTEQESGSVHMHCNGRSDLQCYLAKKIVLSERCVCGIRAEKPARNLG